MSMGSAGCLVNLLFLVGFIMLAFELKSSKAASYARVGKVGNMLHVSSWREIMCRCRKLY